VIALPDVVDRDGDIVVPPKSTVTAWRGRRPVVCPRQPSSSIV